MKNLLKRNKILFDGTESEFSLFSTQLSCGCCGGQLEVSIDNLRPFVELEVQLQARVAEQLRRVSQKRVGDSVFFKLEHLPITFTKMACSSCSTEYIVIIAAGEFQPGRYMAILGGIFQSGE